MSGDASRGGGQRDEKGLHPETWRPRVWHAWDWQARLSYLKPRAPVGVASGGLAFREPLESLI